METQVTLNIQNNPERHNKVRKLIIKIESYWDKGQQLGQ